MRPPPIRDLFGSKAWMDWFRDLRDFVMSLSSGVAVDHATLGNINSTNYTHLTSAQKTDLTDGGTTSLHTHDHGALGGLTDDDHTQYLRTDGTRDSTGEQVFRAGGAVRTQYGWKIENGGAKSYGWRDLLGAINVKGAGGGGVNANPDYVAYRGNIYGYRFGTTAPNNHMHEAFIEYHVPHDWVPGSDAFIHVHWSQIVADTGGTAGAPGVAKWYLDITYADGHGTPGGAADPFISPITVSVTQQASTTQYGHMIAEVQFTNNGGTAGLLDSNTIQVDGLFLVRVYRDPGDVADTLDKDTFVHFVDIHYQSTNLATLNKSPNFYG